ncbi:MAG: HAD family hydrolase [Candidatus Coatesbacteria bacterium]|nr:HAD family hydrolase [Candidatus Coatesbacteria bacterium]
MCELNEIDSVILDMDGTIVLSRDVAVESIRRAAQEIYDNLGIDREPPSEEKIFESIGMPSPQYFAALFPDMESEQRAAIHRRVYELEGRLLHDGFGCFAPGAPDALVKLRDMGLKLAMASNCGNEYFSSNIEVFNLGDYFDIMLCAGMRGYPEKSVLVEEILTKFGSRNAMMVGDRYYDIEAALNCGLFPVGCTYGYGTMEELAEAKALIKDLGELTGLLNGSKKSDGGINDAV